MAWMRAPSVREAPLRRRVRRRKWRGWREAPDKGWGVEKGGLRNALLEACLGRGEAVALDAPEKWFYAGVRREPSSELRLKEVRAARGLRRARCSPAAVRQRQERGAGAVWHRGAARLGRSRREDGPVAASGGRGGGSIVNGDGDKAGGVVAMVNIRELPYEGMNEDSVRFVDDIAHAALHTVRGLQ
ncbi:hypothetical protein FGB62_187g01 [Gracilaria domingensis]|nr:hypothetical protein FGB62_187g01 [Gracilaria domingensis]